MWIKLVNGTLRLCLYQKSIYKNNKRTYITHASNRKRDEMMWKHIFLPNSLRRRWFIVQRIMNANNVNTYTNNKDITSKLFNNCNNIVFYFTWRPNSKLLNKILCVSRSMRKQMYWIQVNKILTVYNVVLNVSSQRTEQKRNTQICNIH